LLSFEDRLWKSPFDFQSHNHQQAVGFIRPKRGYYDRCP